MRFLLSGGGTGGHLFPAIALAEEILQRKKGNIVLFVDAERGIEREILPQKGYDAVFLNIKPLRGKGVLGFISGLLSLPVAVLKAMSIIRKFIPDAVIGSGGYACAPVIIAAYLMRRKSFLLEQNIVPGFTNRILSRFVSAIITAFKNSYKYFSNKNVEWLGNPVRRQLFNNYLSDSIEDKYFTILVFGGSQGARFVNNVVAEAMKIVYGRGETVNITHQTGKKDYEEIKKRYMDAGVNAYVTEFIEDMSTAYRAADLVICRSGATSIAEITVCKKPSILIPYPYAADDHQRLNAIELVNAGAAVMLEQKDVTPEILADTIICLKNDPQRLRNMAEQAGRIAKPEAAREIMDFIVASVKGKRG
ncbi:MAG: undecaprenyldiphospho-muramoylpentapeptide beta-N-acetylglucosaminyltransferase [Deltaproteobacteria bacterium]|nr:undecaprenyldiphospho-muramoylpentapeptide beta-N-acetylglucosaminyltransferase [Deltaproteobacteria bacterium]